MSWVNSMELTLADFLLSLALVLCETGLVFGRNAWGWFSLSGRESLLATCVEVDKALLVAKIAHTRSWMEGGVALQLSLEEGDQLGDCSYLWRPFATIAQITPWHAHACVDGHLSGVTLYTAGTLPNSLSVVSILSVFHTFCNVVHSGGYSMNFELWKWRPTQRAAAASLEELGFGAIKVMKTLSVRGSRAEIRGSFCAKTTVSTWTNLEFLLLNKEERIRKTNFRLLPHTVAFSCLPRSFWVLLIIKGTKRLRLGA